jgi:tight adherence protein B
MTTRTIIILAVMAALAVLIVGYFLFDQDRRRSAVAKRLKTMSAPPAAAVISANTIPRKTEPWLHLVPSRFRERVDEALGATGHKLQLKHVLAIMLASIGVVAYLAGFLFRMPLTTVAGVALVCALVPPWLVLASMQKRHANAFLKLFPDAIDLIVRAVRAGLPVTGALDAAGRETPDPVGSEFQLIAADMRIGLDLETSLRRAAARVRLADFSFFTASLLLQRESGGNLAETLQILSTVLRRRMELRLKTAAMTSEAKTSAIVIGSLPFFACGALAVLNPGYLMVFITDPNGGYIVGAALGMLTLGVLTMRSMIQGALK